MIKNERQYRITKAEAEKFQRVLGDLSADTAPIAHANARLAQAEREATKSQLDDLLREIVDYEDLKSGRVSVIRLKTFDELPEGLIRARIAANLSQKGLAEKLGLKEQQIQRYESDGYRSASFQRLLEIANALEIVIQEEITLPLRMERTGDSI